jgi:tetratricopeptide (TPR) repeat protein
MERQVNREAKASGREPWRLKPTYIPRLMPVGMIIILLALLIPVLREKKPAMSELARVEAPLVLKRYSTGHTITDSLLNEGLRRFARKDYTEATRLLTNVHFHWTVQIREGREGSYPVDLRFFLGLAEFYRGRADRAASYLEEEAREDPNDGKYAWYLAHAYIARADYARARSALASVMKTGGPYAAEAEDKLKLLPQNP